MRYPRNLGRILTLMAILALIGVTLMGCPPEEETGAELPPDPAMQTDDTGDMDDVDDMDEPTDMAEMETVEVMLTDGDIDMRDTVSAGMIMFDVTNEGEVVHSFEIEGHGLEEALESDLQPGESGMLHVELEPGTYEVYCPVRDHADQGMRLELTVTEADM